MPLSIGVLKETYAHEARVALTPDVAAKFVELGVAVNIEHGAGERSHFGDAAFKGAQFHPDAPAVLRTAQVLLKVQPPTLEEVAALEAGSVVIGFLQPHRELDVVRALRDRRITSFAVELVPRISRAQSMDALSSQAAAAGYKAALIAANALDKFLPMLTTAAGTMRPAQVLVIGAGVAGLQAIATARRLGAIVEAYDVRAAT
jgi:NAD(P) transhydrogenase subunit alpha